MPTRVKVCGITSAGDAAAAVAAGADALGFVFYAGSPRAVSAEAAAAIIRRLPPGVARVGVFVDAPEREIHETARVAGLDTVQLHGAEPPEFCRRFPSLTVWKAFRISDRGSLDRLPAYDTAAWLLDSHVPGVAGGTGAVFDWGLAIAAAAWGRPIILAGGLTPANVAEAVRQVRPFGVDVSSGVESAPGRKVPERLQAFVQAVRSVSDAS